MAQGYPLFQLSELRRIQPFGQFWLTDKQDLQQLVLGRFKIGQKPDTLQNFGGQILCFVDDQRGIFPIAIFLQQELVEEIDIIMRVLETLHGLDELEFLANIAEKIWRTRDRAENQRRLGAVGELAKQSLEQRRLTGADLPCQHDKTAARVDAVQKLRQA